MDKDRRFQRLESSLKAARYGSSAKEVLETCALVAEYAQEHTPDQIKAFQEKVKINPQVWLRLLALHRDERLKKHLEHLPASYTTLYAIHRMKDEEIEAAVQQGVIHPKASNLWILSWSKQYRLKQGETVPPWRCLVIFNEEIADREFSVMRFRMNQIAKEYGAKLVSEWDYIQSEPKKNDGKDKLVKELEEIIFALAEPVFKAMTETERANAGVVSIENIFHIDLMTFGYITRPKGEKDARGRRHSYTPIYVYRVALEFLKTDSRSQRFNYKRRLRDLVEKQPDLQEVIEEVLKTYMQR